MTRAMVEVEGLRKRFGPVTAVDGVGFTVAEGTVCGLLGPNGSGKTTTVSILSTSLRPDGGRAEVCGHDVVADPAAVRASIGLAGQFAAVDPNLSGRENLVLVGRLSRLPRRLARPRAAELLAAFGLESAADRLVRTYSGGMRRRLDVAAALAHRPPVLFLDEPTTGLDPDSRLALWDSLRQLVSEGTTVLLTTQYLDEADALADQIVILDAGHVVGVGTPAGLKASVGAVRFELGFTDEQRSVEALAVLARSGRELTRRGCAVHVPSPEGSAALLEVVRALDRAGLAPASVAVREPTLDDVFFALTGEPATSVATPLPGRSAA